MPASSSAITMATRWPMSISRMNRGGALVSKQLPGLNAQHMVHYTRYPIPEVPPVPVYISGYDDMLDRLIADVSNALMPVRRED